jgi:hypothetical protein
MILDSGERTEFETVRAKILEKAEQAVCNDRESQYGTPENSFTEIASFWSAYLDKPLSAKDVAVMMCLFKIARIKTGRFKEDNWIDLVGYAACGAEVEKENDETVSYKSLADYGRHNNDGE